MRRSFTVLAIAAMVLAIMCGAAWAAANPTDVVNKVNAYGLTGTASGSTVTITGKQENMTKSLDLGDISDLTIDWQATLTYQPDGSPNDPFIIESQGNGVFKMTGGKIEILSSASRAADQAVWVFHGPDAERVSLLGGEVIGSHARDHGFDVGGDQWVLEIDGATVKLIGTINSGNVADFVKGDTSKVTGVVLWGSDGKGGYTADAFGKFSWAYIVTAAKDQDLTLNMRVNDGADIDLEGADIKGGKLKLNFDVYGAIDFTGLKGSIGKLTVRPGGVAVLDENCVVEVMDGEVKAKTTDAAAVSAQATADPNYGILEVNGTLTIPAGGSLTVENVKGLIKGSGAAAKISLAGTLHLPKEITDEQIKALGLDPNDGKIKRDAGTLGGDTSGSSSGGACSAGFGLAALAALALIKRRSR